MLFLKEIFSYFNECKKTKGVSNLSDVKFAQQPLWNNNLLRYKSQTLYFKNWIASNISYVKDVFNENDVFITGFSNIFSNRFNWLCKYNINRNVIKKKSILFDMKCCVFPRTYWSCI